MPAARTAKQEDLLGAIRDHLAQLDLKYSFVARLARENQWPNAFARQVVDEYAKFLFVAREGGHPVSPPPKIDQAWHLHLVHTEDYWGHFCPHILKMQLHHSPASGTHDEAAKFADWSGLTLASYRKFFGPPPLMWKPGRMRPRAHSPAAKGAAVISAIGVAATIGGLGSTVPLLTAFGILFLIVGVTLFIISRPSSARRGKGDSTCGSSCGGGSGWSSEGGSHGGGFEGGGGSSEGGGAGGHGCGGHSCGGGGH